MKASSSFGGKISAGQITILFASAGALYAALCPYDNEGRMLINAVISAVVTALLAAPLCVYAIKRSDKSGDVITGLASRCGWWGKAAAVLYLVYFTAAAAEITRCFGQFAAQRVYPEAGFAVCVLLTGAACLYVSHTGTRSICRMTPLIFGLLILTLLLFLLTGYKDIFTASPELFRPESISVGSVITDMRMTGLMPWFIAAATVVCVLCGESGEDTQKGLYIGIAAMLVVFSALTAATRAALGGYADISDYPALDAAVYCSRSSSIPFHGSLYALWIITSVSLISMLTSCGGHSLRTLLPQLKYSEAAAGMAALAWGLAEGLMGTDICGEIIKSPAAPVILLFLLPLIAKAEKSGKNVSVRSSAAREV